MGIEMTGIRLLNEVTSCSTPKQNLDKSRVCNMQRTKTENIIQTSKQVTLVNRRVGTRSRTAWLVYVIRCGWRELMRMIHLPIF